MDTDAAAYITAVETADGQALEEKTKIAIDNFVLGCKTDGIWTAIKASCILAGARTLTGALMPLAGAAPTNYNFVSGDYNRKTGLKGDGSTKYLGTSRNNNADPQNSKHLSIFATESPSSAATLLGTANSSAAGTSHLIYAPTFSIAVTRINMSGQLNGLTGIWSVPTFYGGVRTGATQVSMRWNNIVTSSSVASNVPLNTEITAYYGLDGTYANARLTFYSIGESLDLTLLDARVTALVNAFAVAIP
jgi:hypothetical protein